jgi:hypothetical protein
MMPWQKEVLTKMAQYKGRGLMQVTGRNTGKSSFSAQAFQRLWDDLHRRPIEDLKLSEGTVYGKRYYCVEPVGGNWMDMEVWCMDTFGGPGDKIWGEEKAPEPSRRWYMNNRKFWFYDELDRMVFVLKWR